MPRGGARAGGPGASGRSGSTVGLRRAPGRATVVGLGVVAVALFVYWWTSRDLESPRDDFFWLADAFLHGRTWLDFRPGDVDVIPVGDRFYVPFGPFPAVLFTPLVALVGPEGADDLGAEVNAVLAAVSVGLCWVLLGRLGVVNLVHRIWLVVLFGFATVMWWVTARGGVWHTGQIVATALTMGALVEAFGRRRALVVGLLAGGAFLSRAPLALAVPFYVLLLEPVDLADVVAAGRRGLRGLAEWFPSEDLLAVVLGTLPAVAFFFWYNDVRFGNPLESGYALAWVPDFLERRRQVGLFSLAHLGMNLELFLLRLPSFIPEYPYIRPDGFGMSVLFTSPGLLLALRAPWRDARAVWLGGAALAVLVPTLLYYGGGWIQFGYRYFLDSVPFVVALAGLAVARRGLAWWWMALIAFGVAVGVAAVHWADMV